MKRMIAAIKNKRANRKIFVLKNRKKQNQQSKKNIIDLFLIFLLLASFVHRNGIYRQILYPYTPNKRAMGFISKLYEWKLKTKIKRNECSGSYCSCTF
ncbi:MAG: hypothetical protein MPEBLZ_03150 [Candidatus Methanoperedens nitroreducens]|uniref:Uncharacterized protein n=1 Tax=Candidatus Methanoperedens nitratireducens TaxID=1392998 RepID=A0A0P8CHS4_9EURY|nr:MAG: hypothetical protein MPEBLZ_03150 [Candidatus Methanoperedens sp. BLZ1]